MARKSRIGQQNTIVTKKEKVYRLGFYVRRSVSDEKSESIENQICLLNEYIKDKADLSFVDVYKDDGLTGVNFERPDFNRLMRDIKAGVVDCIIVKDLSRLGRNLIETGDLLENILPNLKVRLIAVTHNYDSNNENANGLDILMRMFVDSFIPMDISTKSSTALTQLRKNGNFIGDYAPYGYLKDGHKLIVNGETAPIVRDIYNMRLEGLGNHRIAKTLNEMGIPSPSRYNYEKGIVKHEKFAKPLWSEAVVRSMLKNPVYLGHLVQGKDKSLFTIQKKKVSQRLPKESWIVVENVHEAIIDKSVFHKVQELIEQRKTVYQATNGNNSDMPEVDNIYRGIVFCGNCNKRLKRNKSVYRSKYQGRDTIMYRYRCPSISLNPNCTVNISEKDLSVILLSIVNTQIALAVDMDKAIHSLKSLNEKRVKNINEDINNINRELEQFTTKKLNLYEGYANSLLSEADYKFANNKYENEMQLLKGKLAELKKEKTNFATVYTSKNKWLKAFTDFKDSNISADMLNSLIEKVVVYDKNNIEITFKYKDEYELLLSYMSEVSA